MMSQARKNKNLSRLLLSNTEKLSFIIIFIILPIAVLEYMAALRFMAKKSFLQAEVVSTKVYECN